MPIHSKGRARRGPRQVGGGRAAWPRHVELLPPQAPGMSPLKDSSRPVSWSSHCPSTLQETTLWAPESPFIISCEERWTGLSRQERGH